MKLILLVILLVIPFIAKADEARHQFVFTSPNGKYEFRNIQNYSDNWSLIEKDTGKEKYQITAPYLYQMTVLVSDDGKTLVAVEDYPEKHRGPLDPPVSNRDVMSFYRDGGLVKKYKLGELVNAETVTYSVSHFYWFTGKDWETMADSKLSFMTLELVHYTFDVNTGEILKKETDPILKNDDLYIYGKIKWLKNDSYEMEVCHVVQGEIPQNGKVKFEVPDGIRFIGGGDYATIIIRDGKMLLEKENFILNACNYGFAHHSK